MRTLALDVTLVLAALLTASSPVVGGASQPAAPPTKDASNCTLSRKLDVAIIYDGSQSMTSGPNLALVKDFIHRVVKLLDIQADPSTGTRVGIWAYTYQPRIQIDFDSCINQEHALKAVNRIRELGATAVLVPDMFSFVAEKVFQPNFGARSSDASVTKVAIILVDSPIAFEFKPPREIKAALEISKVETYAVVIEGDGLASATIDRYLPAVHSPAFAVKSLQDLAKFTGLHDALIKRYGCSTCLPNPCLNNGACEDKKTSPFYECKCIPGWTGANCTTQDPCPACVKNGGTQCTQSQGKLIKCTCPPGRVGTYCHLPDPCHPAPGPCKNLGSCTADEKVLNGYSCKCVGQHTGKNCTVLERKNPCSANPCSGFHCIPSSTGLYTCLCPANCTVPPDCSSCNKASPCARNPCLNYCLCRESPTHEDGFACTSPAGHLGRLCNISRADITCGPAFIEIKLPQELVKEYEKGIPGGQVYLSPIPTNVYNCLATRDASQKKYVVRLPAPFTACGTTKRTTADGNEFQNKLWLNRISRTIDMPVPVVQFKCKYSHVQRLVSTAIQPRLSGDAPIITNIGTFNVSLDAFMRAPGKPEAERGKLTSGSIYIVGEEVFLTATLKPQSQSSTPASHLVVKLLDCYASPVPNTVANKVDLVIKECPVTAVGVKIYENGVGSTATIGFRTFKVGAAQYLYYSCRVDVCDKNDSTCKAAPNCGSKGRRSIDEVRNVLSTGPLMILSEDEKEKLDQTLGNHSDHLYISGGLVDPGDEDSDLEEDIYGDFELVLVSSVNFFILVVFCSVLLFIYIRRKYHK